MPGHTLVIPKNPIEFVWDLPEDDYLSLLTTAKKVALHMRQILPQPYIHMNIDGTDVPHAHIHLVPFTIGADLHKPDRMNIPPDDQGLAEMVEKLKM